PVAPCGPGKFDGIPIDADTQFVDGTFAGTSDGSQDKPWKTIAAAQYAAKPGAVIAIAKTTLDEQLYIDDKPVKVWGACPERVELHAPTMDTSASSVLIRGPATQGTEVHRVAVTGAGVGVAVFHTEDVVIDQVWIHDTANYGFALDDFEGPVAATL